VDSLAKTNYAALHPNDIGTGGPCFMYVLKIALLAIVQGIAELLPVSSSAHVIVVEKLLGLNPTSPEMTLLLVMLHTGTMFAVIVYFWKAWKASFLPSQGVSWNFLGLLAMATLCTAAVGMLLKMMIEKVVLRGSPHAEVEIIFGNLTMIAAALAAVGILILYAAYRERPSSKVTDIYMQGSLWIGLVQGLCLPFRGFSRSGATISTGLILGISKARAEEFSFALAVILTPPVIMREVFRLLKNGTVASHATNLLPVFYPSLLGIVLSFIAGLLALHWLSRWLNQGRWKLFGIYCLVASATVFWLAHAGF
jgi:undecaprenyl-diphosphatase